MRPGASNESIFKTATASRCIPVQSGAYPCNGPEDRRSCPGESEDGRRRRHENSADANLRRPVAGESERGHTWTCVDAGSSVLMRNHVSISPFPLTGTRPRDSNTNCSFKSVCVVGPTWILPGTPVDSIRLARFTESPQMSKTNLSRPITPPTTGPEFKPIRKSRQSAPPAWRVWTKASISSAKRAAHSA